MATGGNKMSDDMNTEMQASFILFLVAILGFAFILILPLAQVFVGVGILPPSVLDTLGIPK